MRAPRSHMVRLVPAVALLLVGLTAPAISQASSGDNPVAPLQEKFEADSTGPSSSADLVSANLRLAARPVPVGEATALALILEVKDGWHVNAHRPTYYYLIGTEVTWETAPDLDVTDTRYPDPKTLSLDFADDALDVYEDTAVVRARVQPSGRTTPDDRRVTAAVRVQACNDETCLRPSTIRASLAVPVAEAGAAPTPTGHPVFDGRSADEPARPAVDWAAVVSFVRTYGALLAGGLLVGGTILVLVVRGRMENREGTA